MSGEVNKADAFYGVILSELSQNNAYLKDSIEKVRLNLRGGKARIPSSIKKQKNGGKN